VRGSKAEGLLVEARVGPARRLPRRLFPYALVAPTLLLLAVFVLWPLAQGLYYSLFQTGLIFDYSVPQLRPRFVGIANYLRLTGDPEFLDALVRTALFTVVMVPLTVVASLYLAVLLERPFRGVALARAVVYWPSMASMIIVGIVWKWLLGYNSGLVNYLLGLAHIPPVPWLVDATMAQVSVVMVSVWAQAGFFMVVLIAGLQTIPQDYYEAARIDGATAWQAFLHVTLPLLRPTLLIVVVLASINGFMIYALVVALTSGGPGAATKYLVQNIYETAFRQPDAAGYAAAQAAVLLVVLLALTLIQLRLGEEGSE
jgi:alpha-1,4-digalacturonate transport system permease protein